MVEQRSERQGVRRAETRMRITTAANELFMRNGYVETTIEEISEAADVAVRTIYLHFGSKAAILLEFHDSWVDAFTDRILDRPFDEPIADTMIAALGEMRDEGWRDDLSPADVEGPHPIIEFIGGGHGDIAGHLMQTWVRAQERMAKSFRERGNFPEASLEPRIRSCAVFAAWLTTILVFRDVFDGSSTSTLSSHQVGTAAIRAFGAGVR
ncbi:MAG: TetR/AcrR family transcriptional regulator [Pseudolysinimonas sp.]|uniref:TetR/AcrR family transcriptional regulator n=1 Tax=Pseudolysinimonas sp. TaxID=2680009 RepID=UPI0032664BE2